MGLSRSMGSLMASQLSKRLDALEKNQPDKGMLFVSELQRMFGIQRIDEAVKAGREGMQQLLNDGYTQMTRERGKAAADAWLNLFVKRAVR
jgi:hypothetical protein